VACLIKNGAGQPQPCEIHHIVDKGYREHSGGDMATIGLCPWHHRGVKNDGMTTELMVEWFGPSLALHKRRFVERFGSERELLDIVNVILDAGKKEMH
jgi:hypothetical protein